MTAMHAHYTMVCGYCRVSSAYSIGYWIYKREASRFSGCGEVVAGVGAFREGRGEVADAMAVNHCKLFGSIDGIDTKM